MLPRISGLFGRNLKQSIQLGYQASRSVSFLSKVPQAPPDAILGIAEAFKKCTNSKKVNLGIGAYRDDNGAPVVLECVKRAQERIVKKNMDNEYAPVQGLDSFIQSSLKLAYGDNFKPLKEKRIAGMQCLSGTGGLRIGWDFCKKYMPAGTTLYMPDYTWPNHLGIAETVGLNVKKYQYFDKNTNLLNFDGLQKDLSKAEKGSLLLLHACSHNPTGVDPNKDQWKQIRNIVEDRELNVFFDMAYLGFTSGNVEEDAFALRHFTEKPNIQIFLAQSFAKNFGLYGQRVGCFSAVCESSQVAEAVESQLKIIARRDYSNPPLHGARIVSEVLNDTELSALWYKEVKQMADRIGLMRKEFVKYISEAGSKKNWEHITKQIGMFAYTGITPEQVDRIQNEFFIFMARDGRISMAGLNTKNIKYVAEAFHAVSK